MLSDISCMSDARTGRASSWDASGRNADSWTVAAGESRVLADIRGPGVITHIWMTQRDHYRDCLLRITWDNASHPSALAPLGDFFGLGSAIVNSYQSQLFTASTRWNNRFEMGCALNCYAPMPFRERALIELVKGFMYFSSQVESERREGRKSGFPPLAFSPAILLKSPFATLLRLRAHDGTSNVFWRVGNGVGEFERRSAN